MPIRLAFLSMSETRRQDLFRRPKISSLFTDLLVDRFKRVFSDRFTGRFSDESHSNPSQRLLRLAPNFSQTGDSLEDTDRARKLKPANRSQKILERLLRPPNRCKTLANSIIKLNLKGLIKIDFSKSSLKERPPRSAHRGSHWLARQTSSESTENRRLSL